MKKSETENLRITNEILQLQKAEIRQACYIKAIVTASNGLKDFPQNTDFKKLLIKSVNKLSKEFDHKDFK